MWVRGLKQQANTPQTFDVVAPHVGAWIETHLDYRRYSQQKSHPMWVRGLKHNCYKTTLGNIASHPMWVRGLKRRQWYIDGQSTMSHPMWVRGLKHRTEHEEGHR